MKRSAEPRASSGSACFLRVAQRAHRLVAGEQRPALGQVEGKILLEAPGVEAGGDVIGVEIVAGEIEVDQAGQLVAEEEDVVGKEVGVDDAGRQVLRPLPVEQGEIGIDLGRKPRLDLVGALVRAGPELAPAVDRQRVRARQRKIHAGDMQFGQRPADLAAMG